MDLRKLNTESDYEHHKRLVLGKLVDGTCSDADYSELAEFLYGRRYASDVARRMMYGSRKTIELIDGIMFKSISKDEAANNLDAKLLEIKKERQQLFDQRREFNKLVSTEGRLDHLYDMLSEAANKLAEQTCNNISYTANSTDDCVQKEAVLVLSDWHYGMVTNNVFNTYNTDICLERVNRVVDKCSDKLLLHNVETLHVVILGDLCHGAIHTSARVASEELVCDQLMKASEMLAESIITLSGYVKNVFVHTTYGNHARVIQRKEDSIHRDNIERIIPWWLKERTKNFENIFVVDEYENEFIVFNSCGHDFCATHGDLDSVKESPKLLHTLIRKKHGRDVEYILLGDKHHRESFDELGITSMICGSLCGTDDYANEKRLYSTPSQLLLIVNEGDGVDAEYRLKC